ncbi:MAG: EAL domain-containing protein, partial [Paracoccaceae bacterium]
MADHVLEVSDPLSMAVTERDKNVLELVRDALDRQQVMLAYQPIVQTERPDQPVFYEGLIRIMDKSGRVIPAREFIDVVETDEIGRRIDCLALKIGLQA